jgi:hypothetical protein
MLPIPGPSFSESFLGQKLVDALLALGVDVVENAPVPVLLPRPELHPHCFASQTLEPLSGIGEARFAALRSIHAEHPDTGVGTVWKVPPSITRSTEISGAI